MTDEAKRIRDAAQKETAVPEETAESAAVNTNPAQHTSEEQRTIEEYRGSVEERVCDFYEKASFDGNDNAALNPVSD